MQRLLRAWKRGCGREALNGPALCAGMHGINDCQNAKQPTSQCEWATCRRWPCGWQAAFERT